MAFPTSGLTDNQVHKEGNRAFVYDSALGVWDQVREEDEGKKEDIIMSGEISPNVVFPTGHIVKFEKVVTQPTSAQGESTTYADLTGSSITYTPATGATFVVYSCQFHYGGDNAGTEDMALWHIMYDGTAEYGTQGLHFTQGGGGSSAVGQKTHQYIRDAWSGEKVIKIRQRAYSTGTYGWFHRQTYGSTNVATEAGPNSSSNYMKVYTTIYSVM